MDLYEYQARDLFEAHGVPVLGGIVARTPAEARAAAEQLGGGLVVVKAQVKVGGRGKAGGVKLARTPQEAAEAAEAILGMDIKGHTVGAVMVAEGADIEQEFYFSMLLDRAQRTYLALCQRFGLPWPEHALLMQLQRCARQSMGKLLDRLATPAEHAS